MDLLGKVRRMKMRDKLTIRQIAKRTGLARNTVKRWLKAPGDVSPRYLGSVAVSVNDNQRHACDLS